MNPSHTPDDARFPNDISRAAEEIIRALLTQFEERVSDRGTFPDLIVGRTVTFGDPSVSVPGYVELLVLHMDSEIDPEFGALRFVSIRVRKCSQGGFASLSCLHGKKADLRASLEDLATDPSYLVARIEELAHGLPEETNPDVWR